MSRIASLAAVLAAALALFAPAAALAAEKPAPAAADLEVEEVYVYDTDRVGNRIGPKVKLTKEEREAHRVGAAEAARAKQPDGRALAVLRRVSGSGCRGVDVARVHRTLLYSVAYKFWQHKDWCWNSPSVTGAQSYYGVSDVDPNYAFRGLISAYGDFYAWCCGTWNSGHTGYRQGQFENCVFHYGCLGTTYPWVRIYGHSDGSFSYDTGS